MKNLVTAARSSLLRRKDTLVRLYETTRGEVNEMADVSEARLPDRAALQSESEVLHGLGERERRELLDIRAALQRIEDGRYGQCEACGSAIGGQRLTAIPEARFCIRCSEQAPR